jgi:FkbM family methyltransferase
MYRSDTMQDVRYLLSNASGMRDLAGAFGFAGLAALKFKYPIRVKVQSIDVALRPCTPDLAVAKSCFSGEFDEAIEAAKPLRHRFIIDAGGYIGTAAIVLAKAFPEAKIVSLEPSRENFGLLRRNVAGYPNIFALNKALGPAEGLLPLMSRGTGEWGFSLVREPADCPSPRPIEKVHVITIPALMRQFDAKGVDLLKLDIEGAELALMADKPSWVNSTHVIFAELHDRIAPGCEAAFVAATSGRMNTPGTGEKHLSKLG